MSRITATKLARRKADGTYMPLQERSWMTCKDCGEKKFMSVGQIWKCEHKSLNKK